MLICDRCGISSELREIQQTMILIKNRTGEKEVATADLCVRCFNAVLSNIQAIAEHKGFKIEVEDTDDHEQTTGEDVVSRDDGIVGEGS